jgi:hypothetical protein
VPLSRYGVLFEHLVSTDIVTERGDHGVARIMDMTGSGASVRPSSMM